MSSETFDNELKRDIIAYLRAKELAMAPFKFASPQLDKRREEVDWLSMSCSQYDLTSGTNHLSVKLLDYFMDGHNIDSKKIRFVAIGCLLIASKIEDLDEKVPRLPTVNKIFAEPYHRDEFLNLEMMICSYFNWQINLPTSNFYCQLLEPHCVLSSDKFCGKPMTQIDAVKESLNVFMKYFLDISLQIERLAGKPSSLVACSIIYCSRNEVSLHPEWPSVLQSMTGVESPEVFHDVTEMLFEFLNLQRLAESAPATPVRKKRKLDNSTPDNGYISWTSDSPNDDTRVKHETENL